MLVVNVRNTATGNRQQNNMTAAYFASRAAVGQQLAHELREQRYYNTVVLALSPASVLVAYEIAKRTYSHMALLMLNDVVLPDERTRFGMMSDHGTFTNQLGMSKGLIEEFEMEYRNAIDHSKMTAMHNLHVVGHASLADPHFFRNKRAILVSDITTTGTEFKAGADFLHTIATEKTILATGIAKIDALWRLQAIGDLVVYAHKTDKDFPPDHYYEDNTVPSLERLIQLMQQTPQERVRAGNNAAEEYMP